MSHKMSRVVGVVALALLAGGTSVSAAQASPAHVDHNHYSKADLQHLHDFLTSNDVSESTATALTVKASKGVLWDSATGVKPVKTTAMHTPGGSIATKDIFADGSVTTTTMPDVAALMRATTASGFVSSRNAGTVGGCDSKVSTHYDTEAYGCLVDRASGYIDMRFRADYTLVVGGTHVSTINKVYTPLYSNIGAQLTNIKLVLVRGRQTTTQKAQAHMEGYLNTNAGVLSAGTLATLDFYVADTSAFASANY